jgi:hypothetical protein
MLITQFNNKKFTENVEAVPRHRFAIMERERNGQNVYGIPYP